MDIQVKETEGYIVILIKKDVVSTAPAVVTPVVRPTPVTSNPTQAPTTPYTSTVLGWTAGQGPDPSVRTEEDQKFLDDILKS